MERRGKKDAWSIVRRNSSGGIGSIRGREREMALSPCGSPDTGEGVIRKRDIKEGGGSVGRVRGRGGYKGRGARSEKLRCGGITRGTIGRMPKRGIILCEGERVIHAGRKIGDGGCG